MAEPIYKARVQAYDVFAQAGTWSDYCDPMGPRDISDADLSASVFQIIATDSDSNSQATLRSLWDRIYNSGGVEYTVGEGNEKYIQFAFPVDHIFSQVKVWVSGSCNVYLAGRRTEDDNWLYYYSPTGGGDLDDGEFQTTSTQATAQASPWALSAGKNSARLAVQIEYRYWRLYIQGSVTVTVREWRPWMLVAGDEVRTGILASVNYSASGHVGTYFSLDDGIFRIGNGSVWALEWSGSAFAIRGGGEWYNQSGVEIDSAHGINIYGVANALTTRATKTGTIQCYVGADGAIYAGAGKVKLDSTGILTDVSGAGFLQAESFQIRDGATLLGGMGGGRSAGTAHNVEVRTSAIANENSILYLRSYSGYGLSAQVEMLADNGVDQGFFYLNPTYAKLTKDLRILWGAYVGADADPAVGCVHLTGNVKSVKGGTTYDVYGFRKLTAPLTHTSFDGDSFSTTTATKIENDSWSSTIPTDAQALLIRIVARDSGSDGETSIYFSVGPSSSQPDALGCWPSGITNDAYAEAQGVVPCVSGDIYYACGASGEATLDVWLECWGYWI